MVGAVWSELSRNPSVMVPGKLFMGRCLPGGILLCNCPKGVPGETAGSFWLLCTAGAQLLESGIGESGTVYTAGAGKAIYAAGAE